MSQGFAYLLIGQGGRGREGKKALVEFAAGFQKRFPKRSVETVFLGAFHPSVQEGIDSCIGRGASEIVILPFLTPLNRQAQETIPHEIQSAKRRFPEVDFHYAGVVTFSPSNFLPLTGVGHSI